MALNRTPHVPYGERKPRLVSTQIFLCATAGTVRLSGSNGGKPMSNSVSASIARTFENLTALNGIEFDGRWFNWGELARLSSLLSMLIEQTDAPPKAKIGLIARNHPESIAAFLGLLKGGCCVVLVNPFQPAQAISDEIAQLGLRLLVAEAGDVDGLGLIRSARENGLPLIDLGALGRISPRRIPDCAGQAKPESEDCAFLIGMSGTSGKPKRIPIRYDTLFASIAEADAINREFGEERTPGLKPSPLIQ